MDHVILSKGNLKGKITNISLRPVLDCGNCSFCKDKCYAKKAYRLYPTTKYAWDTNSTSFQNNPFEACNSIIEQLYIKKPIKYFRIHVAGDFLNQDHIDAWKTVAIQFPETKFLAFTKMFCLDFLKTPKNMKIIYSMWPGMDDSTVPEGKRAWLQDGTETRIPKTAQYCTGLCHNCTKCWNSHSKDIVFNIH